MNTRWTAFTSLFVLVFVSDAASAQTTADDIRGRVKEGQKVVITDAQGRELSGRVIQMTDSLLTVQQNDHTIDIPYPDIVAIDRPRDRLGNGALFGLARRCGRRRGIGDCGGISREHEPVLRDGLP